MKKAIPICLLVLFAGCSPYKNNPLSNSFHDLTAHYNAYFIANEHINEIEKTIFENQDWNYNKVLPIYAQFDSTLSASMATQVEDCIQKASIAIQRHPNSKWEDDSYILVGKARYYSMEFPDAIETFKYVNTNSEDDNARHQALTELIRSFTEFEEYKNAVAVTDYLAKEKLNKENTRRLHMNTAYLYQKKGDQSKMVGSLVKAEELLLNRVDKARINFIIGQTFHELGFESEAFRYYKNVLKNQPNYELEFYAKLYMAQVTKLAEDSDLKKIQKYFKNLLKDPKNKEYQDKIYYELAGFELKNGNMDNAIANYKLSVKNSSNNNRQKGYSYLSLGQIYYDSIKNYELAKSYYDSTVSTMPKDEDNYAAIQKRQEILVDFVKQIVTIQKNDSLLNLASLPEDSVQALFTAQIKAKREVEKEKKKREKQAAINRSRNITQNNGDNLIATATSGSVWYFNNPNAIGKGRNDFIRKWGDRPLENDWRRLNKTATESGPASEDLIANKDVSEATGEEETEISIEEEVSQLMATIPRTDEEQLTLLTEIEEALFNLGNIYNLRLEEDDNAAKSFEDLLSRFPATAYEAEVLYQLFLIYKGENQELSEQKGKTLKEKYPDSIYAKLVDNPNYREESFALSEQLKKLYRRLYGEYKKENYGEVLFHTDSVLKIHEESEFLDNLALLQVLAIGQTEEDHKYQFELGEFLERFPNSELNSYAQSLLEASEAFQQERYNSAKARFIKDFEQTHLFVIVFDIDSELPDKLPLTVDEYLDSKDLNSLQTGNLILTEEKSMLLVNKFLTQQESLDFLKMLNQELDLKNLYKGQKMDLFVITEDNFDILYRTKDVSAYLTFFERNYK